MTLTSRTDLACDCGVMDREARDPDSPIKFDAALKEFNFVHGSGRMRIYHCPFCGGKAPESLRRTLFATIPSRERARLFALTAPATTVSDVIALFGQPDCDFARGVVVEVPERDGHGPTVRARRLLVYSKLSEIADVHIEVSPDDRVAISLQGKYIGPRDSAA